jgi:hypothetical protein
MATLLSPDTISAVANFLSYRALGRFVVTCKLVNKYVTKEDIANIRQRAKENFGKIETIHRPPNGSIFGEKYGLWIRIWDNEEEKMEIGTKFKDDEELICKIAVIWKGRQYVGKSEPEYKDRLTNISALEDIFYYVMRGNGAKTKAFFKTFVCSCSGKQCVTIYGSSNASLIELEIK